MLERVSLSVVGSAVQFRGILSLVSSINSPHFQTLILKLQTAAQRESDIVLAGLVDRISCLDAPLSHLARVASEDDRKFSFVLLGQDPEFLVQGLIDFDEVGYIWAGEEMGENNYFWTFTSPKNGRTKKPRICLLDKLFRRDSD